MTLLALVPVDDEMWPDALAALVAVHPIRPGDGDDDYIAVILDTTLCHMELCVGAQKRGLQFLKGFVDECEDVMVAFNTVKAVIEQVMKECAEAAAQPTKRPCLKKSNTAAGVQEAGNDTDITGESSWPKQKSTSASGGQEASRGKKPEGKLTLATAIVQANNFTSKTKPSNVEAMYKSLEDGLGQCFPYKQNHLLYKTSVGKIHLAPNSFKYHIFVEKRKEQVQLELEALGIICRKLELYCIPLKRALVPGGGQRTKGQNYFCAKCLQKKCCGPSTATPSLDTKLMSIGT